MTPRKIIQSFIASANFIRRKQQEPPPDPWQGQLIDDFENGTDKWTLAHRDANASNIATIEVNATSTKGARGTNWFDSRIFNTQEPLTWVSQTFTIEKPYLNFLIGGSLSPHNRLELIVDGKVVLHASPKTEKNLSPISLDASKHIGKNGRLRNLGKSLNPSSLIISSSHLDNGMTSARRSQLPKKFLN